MKTAEKTTGLELLRRPFPDNQIGRLPKPTRSQTDEVKRDFKTGVRCVVCGGWHHPKVIHLDYVGHAALTDRFLDADESWNWEPMALTDKGLPCLDNDNLLWIKLTICGVVRIGVGDAGNKLGGDAMKERIGDALRNAGMRFGAALDLWHKGDLHVGELAEDKGGSLAKETMTQIKNFLDADDSLGFKQTWHEMDRNEQSVIWKSLNTTEQKNARELLDEKEEA